MKTLLASVALFSGYFVAAASTDTVDPYQSVDPPLVKMVNSAKELQVDGSNLDRAESLLSQVLQKKPDYYRALYNLGLVYAGKNEYDKAIETLKKAEAVRYGSDIPDNSILNSLGWTYLSAGDLQKAEEYFKAAYATKADNKPITNERLLNNLGYLYLQKGQTAEARKYLFECRNEFHSNTATSILKLVDDYERRQNQNPVSKEMWSVYGEQPKSGGEWTERHFDVIGNNKAATPHRNDRVIAFDNVYIRGSRPAWDDKINDFVFGPIVGYIKPGDELQVLEVLDTNASDVEDRNAWYWIKCSRAQK